MYLDYMQIINFLFPPSEDEKRVNATTIEMFQHLMRPMKIHEVNALLPYTHDTVRSSIHLLKFHNHAKAKMLLGQVLSTYLRTLPYTKLDYLLIPIPLSKARLRNRGYNQAFEVLSEAQRHNITGTISTDTLIRTRNTPPQTSLPREKRLQNLIGAFRCTKKTLKSTHIILIDDVTTTGSTLAEAKATLLPLSPASVTCIALAH